MTGMREHVCIGKRKDLRNKGDRIARLTGV